MASRSAPPPLPIVHPHFHPHVIARWQCRASPSSQSEGTRCRETKAPPRASVWLSLFPARSAGASCPACEASAARGRCNAGCPHRRSHREPFGSIQGESTTTQNGKTSVGRDTRRAHRAAHRLSFCSIQGESTATQSGEASVDRDPWCAYRAAYRKPRASTYAWLALAPASLAQCRCAGLVRKPQYRPQQLHTCRGSLCGGKGG